MHTRNPCCLQQCPLRLEGFIMKRSPHILIPQQVSLLWSSTPGPHKKETLARQSTASVNIHIQHEASRLSDCFTKERHIFPGYSLGRRRATFYINIRRQDTVLQVGAQLGPAISRIRIVLAEAREGKNKDAKKVHCAVVAGKRNSILQPGLL